MKPWYSASLLILFSLAAAGGGHRVMAQLLFDDCTGINGHLATSVQFDSRGSDFEGFGCLIKPDANHLVYVCRKGSGENDSVHQGTVARNSYDLKSNTWSGWAPVWGSPATDNPFNVTGGLAGRELVAFFTRYHQSAGQEYLQLGFVRSTDEAKGSSWSKLTDIPDPRGMAIRPGRGLNTHGRMIQVGTTYLQPVYNFDDTPGTERYSAWFLKSTDGGVTWVHDPAHRIYDNALPVQMSEVCVANVSKAERPDTLVALVRTQNGPLYQCHSKDGGLTWSAPVVTNLGASLGAASVSQKIPQVIYDGEDDTLVAIYGDRDGTDIRWSKTRVDAILPPAGGSPTAWEGPYLLSGSTGGADQSYPSLEKTGTNRYFVLWLQRTTGTNSRGGHETSITLGGTVSKWGLSRGSDVPVTEGAANLRNVWIASLARFGRGTALRSRIRYTGGYCEIGFSGWNDLGQPAERAYWLDRKDGAGIRFDPQGGHAWGFAQSGTGQSRIDLGAWDTAYHTWEIRRVGAREVHFFRDDKEMGAHPLTGSVPAGALRVQVACGQYDPRDFWMDWIEVRALSDR